MSIGLGLVGAGIFMQEHHLPAVQAVPSFQIKAVYSRSRNSCESLNTGVDIYSDDSGDGRSYADFLKRDDIQAVIVALPINKQAQYIQEALAAGKHVLSEKPIAANLKEAEQLLAFSRGDRTKNKATWAVAENFRFIESFLFARREIEKLGPVIGFTMTAYSCMDEGNKYYQTAWRKDATHQGGFVLDGGIHTVAGARMLVSRGDLDSTSSTSSDVKVASVSAFTHLVKPHLPPIDSVHAIWRLNTGVAGTLGLSHGSSMSSSQYIVACEKGSVTVSRAKVVVRQGDEKDGNSKEYTFPDEGSGVAKEVKAWAQALTDGKPNHGQSPEEALADLEILEKMLRSGEHDGGAETLKLQV